MNNRSYLAACPILFVLLFICSLDKASAQTLQQTPVTADVNYAIGGYYEALPLEYASTPNKKYPLLIAIHGIGELGTGSQQDLPQLLLHGVTKVINRNKFPAYFTVNNETFSFIVISPQYKRNHRDPETVQSLIDYCVQKYRVDESRIYLTGLSMGGGISWIYAKTADYSKRIAALLTVCGNTDASTSGIANIAATNLPVWATHNQNDNVVPSSNSVHWITGLNGYTPAINPRSLLTIFPVTGHDAWTKTYSPDYKPAGMNVYEWMLSYKRNPPGLPVNQLPVVEAGPDRSITLPVNSITLQATATDADGTIASYKWTKVSGPSGATISNPDVANITISNLVAGSYTFRFTATDDRGGSSSDDVHVVVLNAPNTPPQVNAGGDQTITLPLDFVQLSGSGTDTDGTIQSYQWTKVSGPGNSIIANPSAPNTLFSGLLAGTHILKLTATDNDGAIASDEVKITVLIAPVTVYAQAGNDTLIYKNQTRPDTAFLKGRSSAGATLAWSKISGPGVVNFSAPSAAVTTVTGLQAGTHLFKLTANGATHDTVQVDVRDWQQKGVNPCRPGGGKSFVVTQSSSNSFYRPYINRDNVVGEQVMGGDTLYFKGGTYAGFEIGDFGGAAGCPVYILPKDAPVIVKEGYFRLAVRDSNAIQYAVLDGTSLRSKGMPYGFIMDNSHLPIGAPTGNNLVGGWLAHFEIKGYRSFNTGIFQIKLDARAAQYGQFDKFVQKRIVLKENLINHARTEGLYIGHTDPDGGQMGNPYGPPPRMDSVEIINNIIMNCGWDGIQLANSRNGNVIRGNFVYKTGLLNEDAQRAGILLGGNSSGSIDSNVVINSQGTGIQAFGYGKIMLRGNVVDSVVSNGNVHDGTYMSFIRAAPEVNIPSSIFHSGNLISRASRSYIRVADNSNTMLPGSSTDNYFVHPTETIANNLIVDNAGGTKAGNKVVHHFPFQLTGIVTSGTGAVVSMVQEDGSGEFSDGGAVAAWLLTRLKNPVVANTPPVSNAGADITITLPKDSVHLHGVASDIDGFVTSTRWAKISGPASYSFSDSTAANAILTSLAGGTYKFSFIVGDNDGAYARDTMLVVVHNAAVTNTPPTVDAGANIELTLPVDSTQLSGFANDPDGYIASYKWRKVSGAAQHHLVSDASPQCMVTGLIAGVYQFELTVVDNAGAGKRDTVRVLVNPCLPLPNTPPTANAGQDINITWPVNTATLYGSATDGDGTVIGYNWSKISGPASTTIVNSGQAQTAVQDLSIGTYLFELRVTDEVGAEDADTMIVVVHPAPTNKAPVVDAGPDQLLVLPADSAVLFGAAKDEDGAPVAFAWRLLSGAGPASILSGNKLMMRVNELRPGTYKFELKVADDKGAVGADTVTVTVVAPLQAMVTLDAGENRVLPLPYDSVNLRASVSNPHNLKLRYEWTVLSGPAQYNFSAADATSTSLLSLKEGRYAVQLSATDKFGIVYRDTVEIKVALNSDSRLTIFPNPSTSLVNVRVEANTKNALSQLLVYNHLGKVMYAEQFTRTQAEAIKQIDVSKFPPGVYLVEVSLDINTKRTAKLLRE